VGVPHTLDKCRTPLSPPSACFEAHETGGRWQEHKARLLDGKTDLQHSGNRSFPVEEKAHHQRISIQKAIREVLATTVLENRQESYFRHYRRQQNSEGLSGIQVTSWLVRKPMTSVVCAGINDPAWAASGCRFHLRVTPDPPTGVIAKSFEPARC